jgi:hypothetical protein
MPCLGQTLLKKFISLGNECVEFLKTTRSSHGKFFAILPVEECDNPRSGASPLMTVILQQQVACLYGRVSPASTTTTLLQRLHVRRVDYDPPQGLHHHNHGLASLEGSTSRTCHRRLCLLHHRSRLRRTQ